MSSRTEKAPATRDKHPEKRALATLLDAGWRAEKASESKFDLLFHQGNIAYCIEAKWSPDAREPALKGRLADAVLQVRAAARLLDALPLAVLVLPRLSDRMAERLLAYRNAYAPDVAMLLCDDAGRQVAVGMGLESLNRSPDAASPLALPSPPTTDVFSDRNQWLLKVLIAERLPARVLAAPRRKIANLTQWADAAGVSLSGAARLAETLRTEGYLHAHELRLVRARELLEAWRRAYGRRVTEIRARWLFPPKSPGHALGAFGAYLADGLRPPHERACLGLFAACDALGLGFVQGVPIHLYAEELSPQVLDALGLVSSGPGEQVDVVLRRPRFREAVFRGAVSVELKGGARVIAADALQCWLDVSDHPARGNEQADVIWRTVLEPALDGPAR